MGHNNGIARRLKKSYAHPRETTGSRYDSLHYIHFQMGTSLKGKNLLPEGMVWKITFTTLGDLP